MYAFFFSQVCVFVRVLCVPAVFVMRVAPAVCESLTGCNASLVPLLVASTVPAIKFPKPEKLN